MNFSLISLSGRSPRTQSFNPTERNFSMKLLAMNVRIATVMITGRERGQMIRKRIRRSEHPSILAASIREVGILQPLVVRRSGDGRYELIAGERRLRAAKAAGLATVPIVLRDSEDADLLRDRDIAYQHLAARNPAEVEGFEQIVGSSSAIRFGSVVAAKCSPFTGGKAPRKSPDGSRVPHRG